LLLIPPNLVELKARFWGGKGNDVGVEASGNSEYLFRVYSVGEFIRYGYLVGLTSQLWNL